MNKDLNQPLNNLQNQNPNQLASPKNNHEPPQTSHSLQPPQQKENVLPSNTPSHTTSSQPSQISPPQVSTTQPPPPSSAVYPPAGTPQDNLKIRFSPSFLFKKIKDYFRNLILSPNFFRTFSVVILGICILVLFLLFYRLPLKINLSPEATIILDGKNKGECQTCSLWARPGEHILKIKKLGYKPETIKIYQPWFKIKKLSFQLEKAPSFKYIDSAKDAFLKKSADYLQVIYFNPEAKAFYSFKPKSNEKIKITPSIFYNVEKIKFSPSQEGVVVWIKYSPLLFENTVFYRKDLKEGDIGVYFYDFHKYEITKQQATYWGKDINEISFSPVPGRYYYLGGNPPAAFFAKSEKRGETKLIGNLSFSEGDLAVDSTETTAYLSDKINKIYSLNLLEPIKRLTPLIENSLANEFIFINDDWMLVGSPQGNPEFLSKEKYSLYNLLDKEAKGKELYADKDWFYLLDDKGFIVLEAKSDLWSIKKISLPEIKEEFCYEYLTKERPQKIWFDENSSTLFVIINNKLHSLKINL